MPLAHPAASEIATTALQGRVRTAKTPPLPCAVPLPSAAKALPFCGPQGARANSAAPLSPACLANADTILLPPFSHARGSASSTEGVLQMRGSTVHLGFCFCDRPAGTSFAPGCCPGWRPPSPPSRWTGCFLRCTGTCASGTRRRQTRQARSTWTRRARWPWQFAGWSDRGAAW